MVAARVAPLGALAFGAGSLPILTYPSAETFSPETPPRGICLLCPSKAG